MESERWAAVVDPVGGAALATALFRTIALRRRGGGERLTGGRQLETTVIPFILRGVSLLGVDSVKTPMEERAELWGRLADDLRPRQLDDEIAREIALDELEPALDAILKGGLTGRTVVRVG